MLRPAGVKDGGGIAYFTHQVFSYIPTCWPSLVLLLKEEGSLTFAPMEGLPGVSGTPKTLQSNAPVCISFGFH